MTSTKTVATTEPIAAATRAARTALLACACATLLPLLARAHHAAVLAGLARGSVALAEVQRSDRLMDATTLLEWVTVGVTLVALSCWIGHAYESALALEVLGLPYTPRQARWSYWIPGLHLFRPLVALRGLRDALAYGQLPEPEPRLLTDGAASYRHSALEEPPPAILGPRAPLAIFWTASLGAQLSARVADVFVLGGDGGLDAIRRAVACDLVTSVLNASTFLLAARVLRGLDASLREHARRRRFARPSADAP